MPKVLESYLSDNSQGIPPKDNEIEVSLFGPGFGESIVAHLGGGDWLVVDSCSDENREPVALDYLKKIGVPAANVRLLVATHWHDDHIGGLSRLFESTINADLAVSAAIGKDEFLALVGAMNENGFVAQTGVDEWIGILKTLRARKAAANRPPPLLVGGERLLFKRKANAAKGTESCDIWSLSPSDESCLKASSTFSTMFPTRKMRRVAAPNPNHNSLVIWVKCGDVGILLGADLQETGSEHSGWRAIVQSKKRPEGTAQIFKVPHHGSANGHNDKVWSEMLVDGSAAILTPFFNGSVVLPTASDIDRLRKLSGHLFTTRPEDGQKIKAHDGNMVVARVLKETVTTIRPITLPTSHVRLRKEPGKNWSVGLFGTAHAL